MLNFAILHFQIEGVFFIVSVQSEWIERWRLEQVTIVIYSSVSFVLGWTELSVLGSQVLNQAFMEGCEGL